MEGVRAPELTFCGPEDWINSRPLELRAVISSGAAAVLIDFWDYTCVNCLRTLPYIKEWWRRYRDKGLMIIGIHTPEFKFATRRENLERAVKDLGIDYPVLLDPDYENWTNFANRYWPRKYLIDRSGTIVYDHAGEGAYGTTEARIQELIRLSVPSMDLPPVLESMRPEEKPGAVCYPITPELYTGHRRGIIGNEEQLEPNKVVEFRDQGRHQDGMVFLQGPWFCAQEFVRHARETKTPQDYVLILYHATEVNAVLRTTSREPRVVQVTQDGRPVKEHDAGEDVAWENERSVIRVAEPRMYRIIRNREFGSHELKLLPLTNEFEIYAFTFGSCVEPD